VIVWSQLTFKKKYFISLSHFLDDLAFMQKRDCEEDLGRMGCIGITSSCDYVGNMVTCGCHALNCTSRARDDIEILDAENLISSSPNSKLGGMDGFTLKGKFEDFMAILRRDFRLRYGIEGIGTKNGFLRLGFCKIPVGAANRNDVCFFMHWFFENGFKQLNVRFGHRVTNSTSASV